MFSKAQLVRAWYILYPNGDHLYAVFEVDLQLVSREEIFDLVLAENYRGCGIEKFDVWLPEIRDHPEYESHREAAHHWLLHSLTEIPNHMINEHVEGDWTFYLGD